MSSLRHTRTPVVLAITAAVAIATAGALARTASDTTSSVATPLAFEARVAYQRAIEDVYWQVRLWPDANPAPKPALDAVMPHAVIVAKVDDALRMSAALEAFWGQSITGAMLQAEVERQASASRRPQLLRALWAALGDEPVVVAEMLARPVLAERLLRGRYERMRASDGDASSVHARAALVPHGRSAQDGFEEWWHTVRGGVPATTDIPDYAFDLPAIGGADAWSPTFALPEADLLNTAVWTGAEMIVWGGTEAVGLGLFNSGARYDPATDTWRTTTGVGAPEVRKQHSAVWTGREMIVWGGCGPLDEHRCQIGTGGRYDPITDAWLPTSHPGSNRIDHEAIWTGTEMIVWGGCAFANNVCVPGAVGSEGLRYDPSTDTWRRTSAIGAPEPRIFHTLLWTGSLMLVWGGRDDGLYEPFDTGGRYDPATDTWAPTALGGAPAPRYDHTAVWTGARMIVWGGSDGRRAFAGGRRYDPVANRWLAVAREGAPSPRALHTAVWDGRGMIVWGGCTISDIGFCADFLATGGRYDARANAWTPTSLVDAPEPRYAHRAVWSGSEMIVWGGNRPDPFVTPRTGGRYDPDRDAWTPTNAAEAPTARALHSAIWTGAEMIVWGGSDRFFGEVATGGHYDAATDSWRPTRVVGAPSPRHSHSAIWTGTRMIVWGGGSGSSIFGSGGRYDPATRTWLPTSTAGVPAPRRSHSAVWTGSEMIVWGGSGNTLWMNTGARYDPATDTWTATTRTGAPSGRDDHGAVWTGGEMIVWGGNVPTGDTNTGGRYDPLADAWTPTSTIAAPAPRASNAIVWTGARMLVWGGSQYVGGLNFDFLRDGAVYDPVANAWTPTSLVNAPSERASFAFVWTGDELIVWGGCNGPADCSDAMHTGGEYAPATDTWAATIDASAPSARYAHTGIWTGTEMIVWGGIADESSTFTHHGGRYVPRP